jgi:hypothetical protein
MVTRAATLLLALTCASFVNQRPIPSQSASAEKPNQTATRATLPFAFERNDGQAPAEYQFIGRGRGVDFLFGPRGIDMALGGLAGTDARRVTVRFGGARVGPPIGDHQLAGRVDGRPSTRHREIPTYERLRYPQLYDGVDAVFYRGESDIEYDLLLKPGADPSPITLIFDGADSLTTNEAGDLVVRAGDREIIHRKPVAYQQSGAALTRVDVKYRLNGQRAYLLISPYDRERDVAIDDARGGV